MELRRRIKWKATKKELILYAVGAVVMAGVVFMLIQQRVE
jgi:hypothetical protein